MTDNKNNKRSNSKTIPTKLLKTRLDVTDFCHLKKETIPYSSCRPLLDPRLPFHTFSTESYMQWQEHVLKIKRSPVPITITVPITTVGSGAVKLDFSNAIYRPIDRETERLRYVKENRSSRKCRLPTKDPYAPVEISKRSRKRKDRKSETIPTSRMYFMTSYP